MHGDKLQLPSLLLFISLPSCHHRKQSSDWGEMNYSGQSQRLSWRDREDRACGSTSLPRKLLSKPMAESHQIVKWETYWPSASAQTQCL